MTNKAGWLFDNSVTQQLAYYLARYCFATGVPTENLIRDELASEVPNRVIIPLHAGDGRTAFALAGIAREITTPARS